MHKIEVEKANEFIRKKIHEVIPTYRNHYHLMAPIGWINDPNGFVYFKGEFVCLKRLGVSVSWM